MNVDDVFLMLDAKTYKADYISPNVEKLLGFTVEQNSEGYSYSGKTASMGFRRSEEELSGRDPDFGTAGMGF